MNRQLRALAGAAGPLALVATWAILGLRAEGYSPVNEPISRLAAAGAPTQRAMTAGLIIFGAGVVAYSPALRAAFGRPAAAAAFAAAVASVGIAATPLDSPVGGAPHLVAAGLAYAALAATPLLAASSLKASGHGGAATVSRAVGIATGACFALSVITSVHIGLWQRSGFVLGDAWLVASALWIMSVASGPNVGGRVRAVPAGRW